MNKLNRRDFMKLSSSSLIAVTFGGVSINALARERISLDDPTAKALKYVHESELEGKNCANCKYLQGEEGEEWRPCAFFPGKVVSAKGWCAGWANRLA
ncbi:high-potential iron-sulfur protein [Paraglaciecola sp. 2405UD69-4]|uniref:high-potential iron-sulfur protein n=1 Tax=Paraglaciecola sp. 2405UD69-4 TaxID=3391836 RepID=UPI0039C9F3B2